MPDYQQGKIYKLISPHTDKIYIGSTSEQYLSQRLRNHNKNFKSWQKGLHSNTTSFRLFELGDVEIILLESYPCNSKDELAARERHWIEQNKNLILNINIPSRKAKERYQVNKEKIKIRIQNNKEHLDSYRKNNFECVCGGNYLYHHKTRHIKSDKHQTYLMIQTL
jgi:hypothetical protein